MRFLKLSIFSALALVMASYANGQSSTVEFSLVGGGNPITVFIQRPFGPMAPGYSLFTDTLELRTGVPVKMNIPVEGVSSLRLSHSGKIEQVLLEPGKAYAITFDYSNPARKISVNDPAVQRYNELVKSRDLYKYEFIRDYTAAPLDTVVQRMVDNFEALMAADKKLYADLEMSPRMRDAVYGEIELYWMGSLAKIFARNYFKQRNETIPMYEGYGDAWDRLYEKYPLSTRYAPLPWFGQYASEYLLSYMSYKGHVDMSSISSQAEWLQKQYEFIYSHITDSKIREYVLAITLIDDGVNNKTREEALLPPIDKFLADYPASPFAGIVAPFAEEIRTYHRVIAENDSPDIRFVENYDKITTLKEVLERFRGKPVFLDFWFATCGPCHAEFRHNGPLKTFLKENGIEVLYISVDPSDLEKEWRDAIRYYNLAGWHVRTDKRLHVDLDENYGVRMFPTFMLVDADCNIVIRNAKRPSEGEALFAQIREALGI